MGALLAYLYLCFLPNEIALFIGTVRFEPYRLFLIFYFIYSVYRGTNGIIYKYEKFLLAAVGWVALSNMATMSGLSGLEPSVIYFLQVWVGYTIGRNAIQNIGSFRQFIGNYLWLLLILAPLALYESQNGYRLTHVLASKITGIYAEPNLGPDYYRYGVHRSSTIFSHPILYSVCATAMFIYVISNFYSGFVKSAFFLAIVAALYSAMTSAGFLMVMIIATLLMIERVSKSVLILKPMLVYGGVMMLITIELLSNRGAVKFLMTTLAFNPQTAYMRYAQFEYTKDDIMRSPWFGINGEWTRPPGIPGSVDNYWIVMALEFGLPNLILMVLFWYKMGRLLYLQRESHVYIFFAYLSLTSIGVAALTVHLFDRAQILTYLILGAYTGLLYTVQRQKAEQAAMHLNTESSGSSLYVK